MITFNTVMNRAAMLVDFLCSIAVVNRLNNSVGLGLVSYQNYQYSY